MSSCSPDGCQDWTWRGASTSELSLRIRGPGSFLGSGEPLLVVDDLPVENGATDLLAQLSPYDIQRVDVLKDASATAIDGVRGGNGVVIITTTRPRH